MRIQLTLDITRSKTGSPDEVPEPCGVTDGGAQIEAAPDTSPGWNRIGFVLPSTNEDEPA